MVDRDFLQAVIDYRRCENEYFRNKTERNLAALKESRHKLDKLIAAEERHKQERELAFMWQKR